MKDELKNAQDLTLRVRRAEAEAYLQFRVHAEAFTEERKDR